MSCFEIVSTSEVAVIESFGKFSRLAEAGCVCFCCEYTAGRVTLRIQELKVNLETKTKDNVFVTVNISVQYQAIREKVYSAFYILSNHEEQMRAYVYDVVRSSLCNLTLDQSYEGKEEISQALKIHLQEIMSTYGYTILNALVTDITPPNRVREAMNEINASKRLKEAAYQRAEGEKIVKVKRAEAEAESMYLSGVGVARQRKAIMDGLRVSIVDFSQGITGTTAKDVTDLLTLNQYFDTLQEIGSHPSTKVIFLANDHQSFRDGILQAEAAR
eukprot:gene18547-24268_t